MNNWWENILNKKGQSVRDIAFEYFKQMMKEIKNEGFNKEEAKLLFMGTYNNMAEGNFLLPLNLYWLEVYWDKEKKDGD